MKLSIVALISVLAASASAQSFYDVQHNSTCSVGKDNLVTCTPGELGKELPTVSMANEEPATQEVEVDIPKDIASRTLKFWLGPRPVDFCIATCYNHGYCKVKVTKHGKCKCLKRTWSRYPCIPCLKW